MDEQTQIAATAVMFPDPGESQQWFETLQRTYREVTEQSNDAGWGEFTQKLSEYYGNTASEFQQVLEANTNDPWETVKQLAETGINELVQVVQDTMAQYDQDSDSENEDESSEAEGEEADPAAWDAFVQTLQGIWDGSENSWQQFLDWARYQAYEAGKGVGEQFDRMIDYANYANDKAAALQEWGVQVGQPQQ